MQNAVIVITLKTFMEEKEEESGAERCNYHYTENGNGVEEKSGV